MFLNKLPGQSTIRSWYGAVNGKPGFTTEARDALKRKAALAAKEGKQLIGCLMVDEMQMSIRKQVQYKHSEGKCTGYVDFGNCLPEADEFPIANEALVYLVNCVNGKWKIPVAYFFVHSLTSAKRADLTKEVLIFLDDCGVKIACLTFDGLPGNFSMVKQLGADIYSEKVFFKHPVHNYEIFVILDGAHMEKLMTNLLARRSTIYNENNEEIKWEYLQRLVDLQEEYSKNLANKLTKKHMHWKKNIMNVKIAAQTLSESVAVALTQLSEDSVVGFENCGPTIEFIMMVNNTFDVLNSRSLHSWGYKKPLSPQTKNNIYEHIERATNYFSKLKIEPNGNSILLTQQKTGPLGLVVTMSSVKHLYCNHVESNIMKFILTYKLSQDHLEVFFSSIRAMGGFNNNPNTVQFEAAYKKLLLHNDIKESIYSNCAIQTRTNILTISSRREKKNYEIENILEDSECLIDDIPLTYLHPLLEHSVEYISGFVEFKLKKILKCGNCLEYIKIHY